MTNLEMAKDMLAGTINYGNHEEWDSVMVFLEEIQFLLQNPNEDYFDGGSKC
jgi:hypothetical protein